MAVRRTRAPLPLAWQAEHGRRPQASRAMKQSAARPPPCSALRPSAPAPPLAQSPLLASAPPPRAAAGNFALASALLERGAALSPPGSSAAEGCAWLCELPFLAALYPAFSDWRVLVQRLVAAGASPQELHRGRPPLVCLAEQMAARCCRLEAHFQLLEAFVELGASGADADARGSTPLMALVNSLASGARVARAKGEPGLEAEVSGPAASWSSLI